MSSLKLKQNKCFSKTRHCENVAFVKLSLYQIYLKIKKRFWHARIRDRFSEERGQHNDEECRRRCPRRSDLLGLRVRLELRRVWLLERLRGFRELVCRRDRRRNGFDLRDVSIPALICNNGYNNRVWSNGWKVIKHKYVY